MRNGTCWAGIGFRRDARVDMNNTDYLIGQIWPNGYASVIDAHVNATRPHMMPLGDGDDVTSVIRSGKYSCSCSVIQYHIRRLVI